MYELPELCICHFSQSIHPPNCCREPCAALGWNGVGISNLRFTGVHLDTKPACLCSCKGKSGSMLTLHVCYSAISRPCSKKCTPFAPMHADYLGLHISAHHQSGPLPCYCDCAKTACCQQWRCEQLDMQFTANTAYQSLSDHLYQLLQLVVCLCPDTDVAGLSLIRWLL